MPKRDVRIGRDCVSRTWKSKWVMRGWRKNTNCGMQSHGSPIFNALGSALARCATISSEPCFDANWWSTLRCMTAGCSDPWRPFSGVFHQPHHRTRRHIGHVARENGRFGIVVAVRMAPAAFSASWGDALSIIATRLPQAATSIVHRLMSGVAIGSRRIARGSDEFGPSRGQAHFHPNSTTTLSSKNTFVQKHFHPKTLSSNTISSKTEDNFIHDIFIQKRFHPMTPSSKNGFILWHFHPNMVSSNDIVVQNRFYPMTVSSKTIFILNPKP